MHAHFHSTRPVLRTLFAAIALVVTLSLGAGIHGLAQHDAASGVTPAPTLVASAR